MLLRIIELGLAKKCSKSYIYAMNLKNYLSGLSPEQKKELADHFGTSVEYLSQLANGHRKAGPKFLAGIERATAGQVTQAELRPDLAAA